MLFYILNENKEVIESRHDEWMIYVGRPNYNNKVALDIIGDRRISTVFVGIDYGFGMTPKPIVFETMVFDDVNFNMIKQKRYATWNEAVEGHKFILEEVRRSFVYVRK